MSAGQTESGAFVDLEGSMAGRQVTGPGAPAWLRACSWRTWSVEEKDAYFAQFSVGVGSPSPGVDGEEQWGVVFCHPGVEEAVGLNPALLTTGVLSTWPLVDGLPQVVLDYLIALGYASVDIPVQVGDAAPFGDDDTPLITQLPTFLWVDPAVWQPRSATTPSVFGVTATVTATPSRVVFDNSAGDQVDCGANLGPPYDFGRSDDDQHSECTLTFRHTSAVDDWTLSSTIWWTVTYACSSDCGSGTLPPFVVRNTRPVRVAELQAVLLPPPVAAAN
ncbi:MAG: hypothetical protein R2761_11155 [Acidimicrobiales bacterium]